MSVSKYSAPSRPSLRKPKRKFRAKIASSAKFGKTPKVVAKFTLSGTTGVTAKNRLSLRNIQKRARTADVKDNKSIHTPGHATHISIASVMREKNLIPQAIFHVDVEYFSRLLGHGVERGHDDFDNFEGTAFVFSDRQFTIVHYDGHPVGTSTLYFSDEIDKVDDITRWVRRIARDFDVKAKAIIWQRKDNPEL